METNNKAPVIKLYDIKEWEELKPFLYKLGYDIDNHIDILDVKNKFLVTNYMGIKGRVELLHYYNQIDTSRKMYFSLHSFKEAAINYVCPNISELSTAKIMSSICIANPPKLRPVYEWDSVIADAGGDIIKNECKKASFKLNINKKPIKLNFKL